jgi:hypothetical protein
VEYLKQAASEGQFERCASELRKHREDEAAYAELAKPYAEKGFTILLATTDGTQAVTGTRRLPDRLDSTFNTSMFTQYGHFINSQCSRR